MDSCLNVLLFFFTIVISLKLGLIVHFQQNLIFLTFIKASIKQQILFPCFFIPIFSLNTLLSLLLVTLLALLILIFRPLQLIGNIHFQKIHFHLIRQAFPISFPFSFWVVYFSDIFTLHYTRFVALISSLLSLCWSRHALVYTYMQFLFWLCRTLSNIFHLLVPLLCSHCSVSELFCKAVAIWNIRYRSHMNILHSYELINIHTQTKSVEIVFNYPIHICRIIVYLCYLLYFKEDTDCYRLLCFPKTSHINWCTATGHPLNHVMI